MRTYVRKKINKRKKPFFKAHVRKLVLVVFILFIALMVFSAYLF